jgi:hypothetical protein
MIGYGAKVEINDGASNAFQTVPNLTDIDPPEAEVKTAESKRLDLPSATLTKVPTLDDPGVFTFSFEASKTTVDRLNTLKRVAKSFKITMLGPATPTDDIVRTVPGLHHHGQARPGRGGQDHHVQVHGRGHRPGELTPGRPAAPPNPRDDDQQIGTARAARQPPGPVPGPGPGRGRGPVAALAGRRAAGLPGPGEGPAGRAAAAGPVRAARRAVGLRRGRGPGVHAEDVAALSAANGLALEQIATEVIRINGLGDDDEKKARSTGTATAAS